MVFFCFFPFFLFCWVFLPPNKDSVTISLMLSSSEFPPNADKLLTALEGTRILMVISLILPGMGTTVVV